MKDLILAVLRIVLGVNALAFLILLSFFEPLV